MPRYYEDKPEGGACAGVKEDLGACLLQSDCVLQGLGSSSWPSLEPDNVDLVVLSAVMGDNDPCDAYDMTYEEGKSPRQCLKEGNCKALQYSFFECKRSMLDARSRFRGRKGY